ncbi:hypothetical protein [Pseudomonas sp. BP8]|uniref:hypothetical protein n=1 Tax=Pseudomonas sp. BP8 TaxID=2817864 RepID=UPI001AE4C292|nr:hypothetical protein [Pseudomonas sp. BP8]MBP2261732.1 hypothetical protein [Pseudomonas sp. BP8]HDS1733792.1 hypothetical protein [Pseudomonas putida]
MAKKEKLPPGAHGGAEGFRVIGDILFWGFWTPILYIIFAPWLSVAVVNYWPKPIFAGFFNAMASTGWLVISVIAFVWAAGSHAVGYYRQQQSRKKFAASLAAKKAP